MRCKFKRTNPLASIWFGPSLSNQNCVIDLMSIKKTIKANKSIHPKDKTELVSDFHTQKP